jgi:hypothetical protein
VSALLAVAAIAIVSIGVVVQYQSDPLGLDVFRSHEAAARAVEAGENPYTDAVRVKNGSPNAAPDEYIEGYGYPPVTLVGYVSSDLVFGDSRWISALSLVGIAFWSLRRAWSGRLVLPAVAVLLLAAMPLLRAMIWSGWTEPWTLALFAAAGATWGSIPLSAVLLGLALGTKQYLVLLAPLLLVSLRREPRRIVVAGATAALSLSVAFVGDFDAAWFTLIERPLGLGFRPDSRSVSGLFEAWGVTVRPGSAVMLVLAVAVSWWIGRRVRNVADLFAAAAAVLAVGFLASMAFLNYWFLVAGLTILSIILDDGQDSADTTTRSVDATSV